jgi:cytochrome P450
MSNTFLYVAAFLAIYLVVLVVKSVYASYRDRRLAASLGCKPPAIAPTGLFGIVGFYRLAQAVKNKTWLPFMQSQYEEVGNTFEAPRLGGGVTMTCEPENIKAILATQFADFGLGDRYQHFLPLLGDGIFTLDGKGWSHSRALLRPQFSREQVRSPVPVKRSVC